MAEEARQRRGEVQQAVFSVLFGEPDGLPVQEVLQRAEATCPATPDENQSYPSQPGRRRYPTLLRFATIPAVKAGWLVKDKGVWRLTEEGRSVYEEHPDPESLQREAVRAYQAWKTEHRPPVTYDAAEAAQDAEAAALEGAATQPRRAWLVRGASTLAGNVVRVWLAEGFCSITTRLPDLPSGTSKIEIAKHVREAYPDVHVVTQGRYVGDVDRFINEMAISDLVVTVDGSSVYVGVITGDPRYVESPYGQTPSGERRRAVRWTNTDAPFLRSQLSADAADSLRGQLTVSDVTQFLPEFAGLGGVELDVIEETAVSVGEFDVTLPAPSDALSDELLLPVAWLREIVELLNDKRQLILYGPPGTGKTYLAQELCKALVEPAGGEYAIVQFHPSYAYEDFFEGLRPRLAADGSGGVAFDLVPGPLRRLAAAAAANPSKPYALIIDEINRANLAKVFGELYFLLEYRGQRVTLQYSDEDFRLPRNLFLIGTMNTADRSIALVDAAMRRRFYFQGLFPTSRPICDLLGRWLARQGLPTEPAQLLAALNAAINDDDVAIGPSYLMTARVAQPGGLERIWRTAILPLLEEYYFGEQRDIENEFGLSALRRRLLSSGVVTADPDVSQHAAGDAG